MSKRSVTEYSIIESGNPGSLVKIMHVAIDEGWEPIGGVTAISSAISGTRYLQSIIKRELVDEGHATQDPTVPKEEIRSECYKCQMRNTCPVI